MECTDLKVRRCMKEEEQGTGLKARRYTGKRKRGGVVTARDGGYWRGCQAVEKSSK